jgi:hypothetical protein
MPRVGQVKVLDGERLTDRIAIGVLTSMFPPTLIDEVLQTAGRVEQRHRLLPARVVVYFTLAMCLWADEGYEEVARLLVRWPKIYGPAGEETGEYRALGHSRRHVPGLVVG